MLWINTKVELIKYKSMQPEMSYYSIVSNQGRKRVVEASGQKLEDSRTREEREEESMTKVRDWFVKTFTFVDGDGVRGLNMLSGYIILAVVFLIFVWGIYFNFTHCDLADFKQLNLFDGSFELVFESCHP